MMLSIIQDASPETRSIYSGERCMLIRFHVIVSVFCRLCETMGQQHSKDCIYKFQTSTIFIASIALVSDRITDNYEAHRT